MLYWEHGRVQIKKKIIEGDTRKLLGNLLGNQNRERNDGEAKGPLLEQQFPYLEDRPWRKKTTHKVDQNM